MKRLKLQTDFVELINAIRSRGTTDDMIEGVIEFWREIEEIGVDKVFHIRSGIGEICLHAGYDLLSEAYYDLPFAIEEHLVSVIMEAHRLQANGYTIILEKGKLDDKSEERFFKIIKA